MRIQSHTLGLALLCLCLMFGCQSVQQGEGLIPFSSTIPAPSEMDVDLVVSGRISTLQDIEVVNVGKQIPYTYAEEKTSNTPGYDWYVSKHFAMKTNFPEDQVYLYMKLLEMSYPHYVEIFGVEPPNIENQRIPAVYAPTRFQVGIAMMDDGFTRGPGGGGECMFYNRVGYNFKSSREQHQRYIVIHETCHAYQMAVMDYTGWFPIWFIEGVADGLAHHIYDPEIDRLTLLNFDRGSPMDYVRRGLEEYEKLDSPSIEDITMNKRLYRGVSFLLTQFMLNDPERSHKFKIFRDQMTKLRAARDESLDKAMEVLKDVFGDWDKVEADWTSYIQNIDKSFHVAGGPWEQEGNAYFVRHYNSDNGTPRLDFLLPPGEKPYFKPFKFDQPMPNPSPLIIDVARGVDEPTVGLKVKYYRHHLHRGKVGIGFGLQMTDVSNANLEKDKNRERGADKVYNPDDDELYEVLVERGNTLVFDGRDLGGERLAFALPQSFVDAMESQKRPELGINVQLKKDKMVARLLTGNGPIEFKQDVDLDPDIRKKLLNRSMAIMAEDANHLITPYFDDGRDLNPNPVDLNTPAPQNVFRNPADREITRLTEAVWLLGDDTPESVQNILVKMNHASIGTPAEKDEAMALIQSKREEIADDLAESGSENGEGAVEAFAGTFVRLEWGQKTESMDRSMNAVLYNPSDLPITGSFRVDVTYDDSTRNIGDRSVSIPANGSVKFPYIAPPYRDETRLTFHVHADLKWAAQDFQIHFEEQDPYPWSTVEIVEPAHIENDEIRIATKIRATLDGETKGDLIFEVMPGNIVEENILKEEVDLQPFAVETFSKSFKLKEGVKPGRFAVHVRFDCSLDGEPLWIDRRSIVEK